MSTFVPIAADSEYGTWQDGEHVTDFDAHYDQDNHAEVESLLVGRAVEKVADDHLLLSDGTLLKLVGHEGGCACSAGDYDLTVLNGVENIITAVTFDDSPAGDEYDRDCQTCGDRYCYTDGHDNGQTGAYRIFVFTGEQQINLATFEGSDGNGYYGTGYHILVRRPAA